MLANNKIIGFAAIKDKDRAKEFYEKALGLPFVADDGFALVFNANGNMLRLVKVPHFAMANLIAGDRVVPEVIQRELTPERVAVEVGALLDSPTRRERMRDGLAEVRRRLGEPGASARAAAAVLDVTRRQSKNT